MLSEAGALDVLFKTTLALIQAATGENVAVGNAFTLTVTLFELTQPLFVVAVNTAVKFPAVA